MQIFETLVAGYTDESSDFCEVVFYNYVVVIEGPGELKAGRQSARIGGSECLEYTELDIGDISLCLARDL